MTGAAKVLQFPLAGIARDQDYRKAYIPSEGVAFATPFAVNVIGSCTFGDRRRGGSRPGLKPFTGTTERSTGIWMWPNGDYMDWSDATSSATSRILFSEDATVTAPDGGLLFNPHATFGVKAAKGSVPDGCTVMAKYRARLIVAKDAMWYASRQGDVTDFDYGGDGDDTGRACAGNVALADAAGETVTALAAIEDKYLVVATNRCLRVLSGEPTEGEWATASEYTGIIGRDAWCWDGGTFWFMGQNGMYAMVPGENTLKKVSGRLPDDFKGWSSATLVYDAERGGIHILGVRETEDANQEIVDWFYDVEQGAYWKMDYPTAKRPASVALCVIDGVNRVVFKCADGVWRYWGDTQTTDDGTAMASKVAIGPLRTALRDDMDGMLAELTATMGEDSASVTVEIYADKSPEKAVYHANVGQSPKASYTVGGGWNHVWRPRTRGAWVVFVVKSSGRWAYESMTAVCKALGRLRV